jgi:hypothetical protein
MQGSDEAMIYFGTFNKFSNMSDISEVKPKNIVVFAFTYVVWRFQHETIQC